MGEGSLKLQKYLRKSLMTEKQSSQKEGLKLWRRAGVRRAKLSEKVSLNQERTRDQTQRLGCNIQRLLLSGGK